MKIINIYRELINPFNKEDLKKYKIISVICKGVKEYREKRVRDVCGKIKIILKKNPDYVLWENFANTNGHIIIMGKKKRKKKVNKNEF